MTTEQKAQLLDWALNCACDSLGTRDHMLRKHEEALAGLSTEELDDQIVEWQDKVYAWRDDAAGKGLCLEGRRKRGPENPLFLFLAARGGA